MKLQDAYSVAAVLSVASAHTIMQSFNGNPMGDAIYMPSSNMVNPYSFLLQFSTATFCFDSNKNLFTVSK